MAPSKQSLDEFLQPLHVDAARIHNLAKHLASTFTWLGNESKDQFLPTPISESILRFEGNVKGQYLAIDIGGTNLRVGFIELLGAPDTRLGGSNPNGNPPADLGSHEQSSVRRHLEKSWPIGEQLKKNKAEDLFAWTGTCIAEVVREAHRTWDGGLPDEIPLGVTFSFPMIQYTLSEATLMSMGKGFAITSNLDLGKLLLEGYRRVRDASLPRIKIAAIVNDSVATLVSFAYQLRSNSRRKAAMALIVGTGTNATIPLALSKLHPSKRPADVKVIDDRSPSEKLKITVNTEWSINGSRVPLAELNFITDWDKVLDSQGESPGFQPFEYMTAGRYLGELGRLIILDYFTNHLHIPIPSLPPKLLIRNSLTTSFLGNIGPHLSHTEPSMLRQLESELPPLDSEDAWRWTEDTAEIVFKISKAIQLRAAGMTAAAVIAVLACADEIPFPYPPTPGLSTALPLQNGNTAALPITSESPVEELMVGYTGGCIVHFQDYLEDCQRFLDVIMEVEFESRKVPRVLLTPCHDGGIIGAGILAGTVMGISDEPPL